MLRIGKGDVVPFDKEGTVDHCRHDRGRRKERGSRNSYQISNAHMQQTNKGRRRGSKGNRQRAKEHTGQKASETARSKQQKRDQAHLR